MALRWLLTAFPLGKTTHLNIYREYCKAVSADLKITNNPFYEKYADKLSEFQKTSSEDLELLMKNKKTIPGNDTYKHSPADKISSCQSEGKKISFSKELDQIMKIDAVKDKSAEEIELIWKQYHKSKDGIYAVLPGPSYEKIHTNSKKFPLFLLPLPRAQGYEFVMLQFFNNSCYFTSLINYQAFKENAPVCLTITYFTEFRNDKGVVLMKGEYDESLKTHEAQCLANQLQIYYGGSDEKKEKLLWTFNKQPHSFRHMDLISNFEYNFGT